MGNSSGTYLKDVYCVRDTDGQVVWHNEDGVQTNTFEHEYPTVEAARADILKLGDVGDVFVIQAAVKIEQRVQYTVESAARLFHQGLRMKYDLAEILLLTPKEMAEYAGDPKYATWAIWSTAFHSVFPFHHVISEVEQAIRKSGVTAEMFNSSVVTFWEP